MVGRSQLLTARRAAQRVRSLAARSRIRRRECADVTWHVDGVGGGAQLTETIGFCAAARGGGEVRASGLRRRAGAWRPVAWGASASYLASAWRRAGAAREPRGCRA
eukprot:3000222-Prymnesium_polylepis.1